MKYVERRKTLANRHTPKKLPSFIDKESYIFGNKSQADNANNKSCIKPNYKAVKLSRKHLPTSDDI